MRDYESILSIMASLEGFGGISYLLRVNFEKNTFVSLEWRNKGVCQTLPDLQTVKSGDLEEFKREVYSLNIRKWKPSYRKEEGIILEGKYWSVKLKTKEKMYASEGTECFPANWDQFCRAVEKLTGTPFR
ncbi:hypothetical protein J1P26_01330 [Neobacillus sp. MM2021_6]|uniref:hypothetical protein n=1 Tax=Bacillaceae TaxID=186817 RepID=UPI00140C9E4E|nr:MULTISPECIES: hypothetical protein [Bacillaceae]MBO0958359.1 hypothetical protein [Neobacillus sp. MM2021_6]NHC17959.1 hypothetical protein [Bacillus sp. MM2020_4]WML40177.1 hypothetical protein RCG19_00370 [Neobacillus sp. OS1-2]